MIQKCEKKVVNHLQVTQVLLLRIPRLLAQGRCRDQKLPKHRLVHVELHSVGREVQRWGPWSLFLVPFRVP